MDRAECIIVLVVKVCIVDIAFNRLQQIEGDLSTIWIVYEARNGEFLFFPPLLSNYNVWNYGQIKWAYYYTRTRQQAMGRVCC